MKKYSLILFVSFVLSQTVIGQTARKYTLADYEKACVFDFDSDHDKSVIDWDGHDEGRDYYHFYEGFACVSIKKQKYPFDYWGFINTTGKEIIPIEYDDIRPFSEGFAAVLKGDRKKNNKWGYINTQGNLVIPTIYEKAQSFSEGLACVKKNGKYGYLNKQGTLVIPAKYDNAFSFSEGLACVELNGKYGYINKQGQTIISFKYVKAGDFSEGLAGVGLSKDKYGYINKQGNVVIPLDSYITGIISQHSNRGFGLFKKGYTICRTDEGWMWIDKKGKRPNNYADIWDSNESIRDGIYVYYENRKEGLKKTDGTIVISALYDDIFEYENGHFCVQKDNKFGVIDKNGILIVPCKYDDVRAISEGMFAVKRIKSGVKEEVNKQDGRKRRPNLYAEGKYAFVNSQGIEVTPFVFDKVKSFKDGFACVTINNKMGFIDKTGSPIKIDLSGETMYKMGEICESKWKQNDPSTNKYIQEALNWFKKGAAKANKFSTFKVGLYYVLGQGNVPQNYLEGAKWLEKTIRLNGKTNGLEFLYLGTIYKDGGFGLTKNEDKAIKYFTDGAQIMKNASCYNELAYIYANKKNYNLALNYIDKAIQISSSNIDKANFYDSKGEIYLMMGKDDEALKMWNKVMTLNPKYLNDYPQGTELYKKLKAKGKI